MNIQADYKEFHPTGDDRNIIERKAQEKIVKNFYESTLDIADRIKKENGVIKLSFVKDEEKIIADVYLDGFSENLTSDIKYRTELISG